MRRRGVVLGIMLAGLLAITAVACSVGGVAISWRDLVVSELSPAVEQTRHLFYELRLPRVLLGLLVGAGLGASGAGYQGLFRNPLADPFVLGASSGAALGAALSIVSSSASVGAFTPLAAFLGALFAIGVVFAVAQAAGERRHDTLLLAGVTVSSFFSSLMSLVMHLHHQDLPTVFSWILGSVSNRGWSILGWTAPYMLVGAIGLWLMSRRLDALSMGESAAQSLGLHVSRARWLVVLFSTLTTAGAVAGSGVIAFVGLIAPHIARRWLGAQHGGLIVGSALVGAGLLVLADAAARSLLAPAELPVGVLTALVGGPFFLLLLWQRRAWSVDA